MMNPPMVLQGADGPMQVAAWAAMSGAPKGSAPVRKQGCTGRIRSAITKADRLYSSRRYSDFRAASLVCKDNSLRSAARHALDDDAAGRYADDLRPAKSFAAGDVESIVRITTAPSAVAAVITVIITITVINADATRAEPQLQVLRGNDRRRDGQPSYGGQANQDELKRFPHEFLPWSCAYRNDNLAIRILFLMTSGDGAAPICRSRIRWTFCGAQHPREPHPGAPKGLEGEGGCSGQSIIVFVAFENGICPATTIVKAD